MSNVGGVIFIVNWVWGISHRFINSPFSQDSIDFGTAASVIDIAAGGSHACALFETGQIKCWGRNHQVAVGLCSCT